jgi:peroxiredoxin
MAALREGTKAPDFSLPLIAGGMFSLQEALKRGSVMAAFFKASCPVCQYAFPFFERLEKAYGSAKAAMVGISQDNKIDTAAFVRQYGITFPVLLDDPAGHVVSNAYGLTTVPTWFIIAQNGEIMLSSVGWARTDVEDLNRRMAEANYTAPRRLFRPGEGFPNFPTG